MSYIEFKNVNKIYKMGEVQIKALDNTSFDIEKGEHKIEMTYRPDCVKYGIIISCCGVVIFISYIIAEELIKKKKANTKFPKLRLK